MTRSCLPPALARDDVARWLRCGWNGGTGSFPAHCAPTGLPSRLRPFNPWVRNDSRSQQTEACFVLQIVLGRRTKSASHTRFSGHCRMSRRAALPSIFCGSSVVPPPKLDAGVLCPWLEANAAWYRVHRMAGVTCRFLSVCFAASQEAARHNLRTRQEQELQVTTHETRVLRVEYRGSVPHSLRPLGASRLRPTFFCHMR